VRAAQQSGKIHPFLPVDVAATAANLKPIDAAGSTATPAAVYLKMARQIPKYPHQNTRDKSVRTWSG
jgi:hypothetical protein